VNELRVNRDRLWDSIVETSQFGATPAGGMNRLTLSDEDRMARDWFVEACKAIGCTVISDDVGNVFARRPGTDNSRSPIAIGSHLDTQPQGGRFDGVAGVLSGLEVLRTLDEAGYKTTSPIEVINWTNEEGSRFAPTMIASGVFAGIYSSEFAHGVKDRDGKTFGGELQRIGYLGETPAGNHPLAAYFELHIEQGPILYDEGTTIGVVTGAQGQLWYEIAVTGRAGHAGSTPMHVRSDAMLACARITEAVNAIAKAHGPAGVGTVGLVELKPNSRNVIPGEAFFTVDMRHPDEGNLRSMGAELDAAVVRVSTETETSIEANNVLDLPPMRFDAGCVSVVREVAQSLGYSHRDLVSGPGHDAVYVARVAPAAMVFVPCERGLSHNEAEYATPEDVEAGANVLLHAVLELDRRSS